MLDIENVNDTPSETHCIRPYNLSKHSIHFWVFLSKIVINDLWLFQFFLAFLYSLYQELSGYVSQISLVFHIYP